MLNQDLVAEKLAKGELIHLQLAFEKADILQGVDVVWSQTRHLGAAGSWMLERLQELDMTTDMNSTTRNPQPAMIPPDTQ